MVDFLTELKNYLYAQFNKLLMSQNYCIWYKYYVCLIDVEILAYESHKYVKY